MVGENVILQLPEPEDIDPIYAWENDPEIWKVSYFPTPVTRHDIYKFVLNRNKLDEYHQVKFIIKRKADGEPMGSIDLFDYDARHQRAGIGIQIARPFRGKGFALEALQLIREFAFRYLHLKQLYCTIAVNNSESISLFRKAGFEETGVRKEWIGEYDGWTDELFMQLINKDK